MHIYHSSQFERQYKKLPVKIQDLVEAREALFIKDPFDPRLKTHKLSGNLEGFWSYSVSYSYRIIFEFLHNKKDIRLHDIGTHDVYE